MVENYIDALHDANQSILLNSAHALTHNVKGLALVGLNRHPEALEAYDVAITLDSQNHIYFYHKYVIFIKFRSVVFHILHDYVECWKNAMKAIELNSSFAPGHNMCGMALVCLHRYREAVEAYSSAIALDPKYLYFYSR